MAVFLGWRLSQPKEIVVSDEPITDPNLEPFVPEPEKPVEAEAPEEEVKTASSTAPVSSSKISPRAKAGIWRSVKTFIITVLAAIAVNFVVIAGSLLQLFHIPPEWQAALTGIVAIVGVGLQKSATYKYGDTSSLQIPEPDTGEKT